MDATTILMKLAAIGPHAVAFSALNDGSPSPAVQMTFDMALNPTYAPAGVCATVHQYRTSLSEACALFAAHEGLALRCMTAFASFEHAKPEQGGFEAAWLDSFVDGMLQTAGASTDCAERVRQRLADARATDMMMSLEGPNPFNQSVLGDTNPMQMHFATNVTLAILIIIANARGELGRDMGAAHKAFYEGIQSPLLREIVEWSPKTRPERLKELLANTQNIHMGLAIAGMLLVTSPGGDAAFAELHELTNTLADVDGPRTAKVDEAVAKVHTLLASTQKKDAEEVVVDLSGEDPVRLAGMAEVPLGVYMHLASARGDNSEGMVQCMKDFLDDPKDPVLRAIFSSHTLPITARMQNLLDNQELIGPSFAMLSMFLRERDDGKPAADALRAYIARMADVEGEYTPAVTDALGTLERFMSLMP